MLWRVALKGPSENSSFDLLEVGGIRVFLFQNYSECIFKDVTLSGVC